MIILVQHWRYYYSDIFGLPLTILKILFCLCNVFCYALSQLTIGHIYLVLTSTYIVLMYLFFVKLKQTDDILRRNLKKFNFNLVSSFMRHHTNTFRHIMIANELIGTMNTIYMVANFPCNLYLIMFLFVMKTEQKTFLVTIFVTMIIAQQLYGYLIVHRLSAIVTQRIHGHRKTLIHIYAHNHNRQPAKRLLRMSNYIEKFHTKKRYGYTYYNCGLITMETFIEVSIS